MKKTTKQFLNDRIFPACLSGLLILVLSCNKDKNDYNNADGPPTIERVRLTDPSTADSSLKQAAPGNTLALVGTNLSNVTSVSFNGYKAAVNPVYATNNYLIVSIPDSVPTVATDPDVPNEIKVVTQLGEATYSFIILPAAPILDHISNEYAQSGDELTLYGENFFYVDTVLFPGEIPVTQFTTSADGRSITVTIPSGTSSSQESVRVKTESGWSIAAREGRFYDHSGSGMILNWDALNSSNHILNFGSGLDVASQVTSSYGGIHPIENKYAVINQPIPANWASTNAQAINLENLDPTINSGDIFPASPVEEFDPATTLANFDLKFEMAATQPIGSLQLQVSQHNGDDYLLDVPLSNFIKTADGKWYTVSANLGDLASSSGSKLASYGDLKSPESLQLTILNGSPAAVPATLAVDNIRIVNVMN